MQLSVPTSLGDALDRYCILQIKQIKMVDPEKRANVRKEAEAILRAWTDAGLPIPEEVPEFAGLKAVNLQLWEVEDALRLLEARQDFGPEFVQFARSVYVTNDQRAALKRAVNLRFGSALLEEKQHPTYHQI